MNCDADFLDLPRRFSTLGALTAAVDMHGYVPAPFVTQKAKSVCDGIMAALEGLSTDGDERGMGVCAFLDALSATLAPTSEARDIVDTARDLGAGAGAPRLRAQPFLENAALAKPVGFYTWSRSLEWVFRRDRFLQQELEPSDADALAAAIENAPRLRAEYERHLRRVARLTNPFALPSLVGRMTPVEPRTFRGNGKAIFPPSDSVENHAKSASEFLRKVADGAIDLRPSDSQGFYAHQLYALTALLQPAATPESRWRTIGVKYAAALEVFAAANLFFARESHVKQLALAPGAAASARYARWIQPELTIEPLPTFYALTANAFRFLRVVVEEGWGRAAFEAPQLREEGPIAATIGSGIDDVITLCEAAAELSRCELAGAGSGADVDAWRARLRELSDDPDVTGDARGMVPLGLTKEGDLRVLIFAGWEVHGLFVEMTHVDQLPPDVGLGGESHALPIALVRETVVPVAGLLDRQEVRTLCDRVMGEARSPVGLIDIAAAAGPP